MELVKRGKYWCLRHSFRKNGKVVSREKYIGLSIPENITDIESSFLRKCLAEEVFIKLTLIQKSFHKEWATFPESIKKKYLIDLSINITYNSNAIEGSKITLEETENIVKHNLSSNKSLDDTRESLAHSKLFFKVLQEKRELSLSLLLEWHNFLFRETKADIAGNIRVYSVKVGDYRAPDWQDLKKLLVEYFNWYKKNQNLLHPVELASRMHYKFEKIHPFGDGNGRIGRLIMVYILSNTKYPILIIENKKKKQYYHALIKDENAFLQYAMRIYLSYFKEYLK